MAVLPMRLKMLAKNNSSPKGLVRTTPVEIQPTSTRQGNSRTTNRKTTNVRRKTTSTKKVQVARSARSHTKLTAQQKKKKPAIKKEAAKYVYGNRAKLALLIAAHNEEMVIEPTLRSAIKAGMKPEHIYVVNDNSSDKTAAIARSVIGKSNVCTVGRSGKGLALTKAGKRFQLTKHYQWIHIADADGGFAPNYFKVFRKKLRVKNAAATGYVKSLPGGNVSQFRVFEYTIGLEIHRRIQSFIKTVPIIPGPTSCFRADVFDKVNFANHCLTEDFDVTLQLHRQKLGNIQYIPGAVAYTQDPRTVADYIKQISRWNRGLMQGIKKHRIGLGSQRIDAYLGYQLLQNLLFIANYLIAAPLLAYHFHSIAYIAKMFLVDVFITLIFTILVIIKSGRWDIFGAFPIIFGLRLVSMVVFAKAFVDVMILNRFTDTLNRWPVSGRRYQTTGI